MRENKKRREREMGGREEAERYRIKGRERQREGGGGERKAIKRKGGRERR